MGCREANNMLGEQIRLPSTSPFLGLLPLPEENRIQAIEKTKTFLNGHPEMLSTLFSSFPYVGAWAVTHALNENYAMDGQKIYKHIEEILGISLESQHARKNLHKEFCGVCTRLGLPTKGLGRMVNVYLLHAGVSVAQLSQLLEGFVRQHEVFGPPPNESSVHLNRWEDDSLDFMSQTVITPRRAILWDETAWHAALYARIAAAPDKFTPSTEFEQEFLRAFNLARDPRSRPRSNQLSIAKARLYWTLQGLTLRIPRTPGRVPVWIDAQPRALKLKGGEDWAFAQPWPKHIKCQIDEKTQELEFLPNNVDFVVFDLTTGHQVEQMLRSSGTTAELDTAEAVFTSREPFSFDGIEAEAAGDSCFFALVALGARPCLLKTSNKVYEIRTRPRRRLILTGRPIATGPKGHLYAGDAIIHVETGLDVDEIRVVRCSLDAQSWKVRIPIKGGVGELILRDHLNDCRYLDPQRLQLDLMSPSENFEDLTSSRITLEAWVWMGFLRLNGLNLSTVEPPKTFLPDYSTHLAVNDGGHLHFDRTGGYDFARAVFSINDEMVAFKFPWPDVSMSRHRTDGSITALRIGSLISVGPEDQHGHISIRCPDSEASLLVGNRLETKPFAFGMTRNLAIGDITTAGQAATVMLMRKNGTKIFLVELVDTLVPRSFEIRPSHGVIDFTIKLDVAVDAIALEVENEFGERERIEVALGRYPISGRTPDWISARITENKAGEVSVSIGHSDASNGMRLGRIYFRPEGVDASTGNWRPLRNSKGGTYAVPLVNGNEFLDAPDDRLRDRFDALNNAMSECYAQECWPALARTLKIRWQAIGEKLGKGDIAGSSTLMNAALLPISDTSPSNWLPYVHPVEFHPEMYSASAAEFVSLSDLPETGLSVLSKMRTISQDQLRNGPLDLAALAAFKNFREAQTSDEKLRGFKPEKFFEFLPVLDGDPSSGWFWSGEPILGAGHWRAAFQLYLERLEAAEIFTNDTPEAGINSQRSEVLQTLISHVGREMKLKPKPPSPKRLADDEFPVQLDIWVATTLSEFARVSRNASATAFVDRIADDLMWKRKEVLASIGLLLRLAPELFGFYLLMWEIARERA